MPPRRSRARGFCFTINNPTDLDKTQVTSLADVPGVDYLVCGSEVGASGTPHLQGFVHFENPRAFSAVTKALPRAHVIRANGTAAQNRAYCLKESLFLEKGELPGTPSEQGETEKCRWERAWEVAKSGGDFELIAPDIRIRCYSTLLRIRAEESHVLPPPIPDITNRFLWFVGPTGSGKSRYAFEWCSRNNRSLYLKGINKWWSGYRNQDVVLIEEWHCDVVPGLQERLKAWADHNPFPAETKGGHAQLRPPMIIVCSNYTMEECFQSPNVLLPLKRRFTVVHFPLANGCQPLADVIQVPQLRAIAPPSDQEVLCCDSDDSVSLNGNVSE